MVRSLTHTLDHGIHWKICLLWANSGSLRMTAFM
jgi:hypothetical protein